MLWIETIVHTICPSLLVRSSLVALSEVCHTLRETNGFGGLSFTHASFTGVRKFSSERIGRAPSSPRGADLNLSFFGVRGSTPCACDANAAYGGNTACVVVEVEGRAPMLLDLGTGLRFFGLTWPADRPFRGTALVTHLHWDHVQGIPFFGPLLREGSSLDFYGPPQEDASLETTVRKFISPPYFPVGIDDLPGEITFHEMLSDTVVIDGVSVTSAPVPHCGLTLGYRIEYEGASVVYVSDHQQPGIDSTEVDPAVLELCRGAGVLIHDAQYDRADFMVKSTWGHCTHEYAVEVAAQAGVDTLVLFHHDPSHGDAKIDQTVRESQDLAFRRGVRRVIAASEGMRLEVESRVSSISV